MKAGSRIAFNDLVLLYRTKVINTCYKFLLNIVDAEDISQEVFIEVYQSIGSFRGEAKLSTWIYRIAVSKSMDELKRRKRKKRISSIGKLMHIDDIKHWISGEKTPDQILIQQDSMQEVTDALNTLPDNQRIAFTLSKIEGYNNEEIADIMNLTLLAVESLVYRAKKKIGEELKQILKKNTNSAS